MAIHTSPAISVETKIAAATLAFHLTSYVLGLLIFLLTMSLM